MARSRLLLVLSALVFLAAVTASAQVLQTNVTVSITARTERLFLATRVPVGATVLFDVRPQWHGTVVPANVVMEFDVPGELLSIAPEDNTIACSGERPVRCRVNGQTTQYSGHLTVTTLQSVRGDFMSHATISTSTREQSSFDNTYKWPMQVLDQPSLSVRGWVYPLQIHPSKPGAGRAEVFNDGDPARNAAVTITLPNGGTFTDATVAHGKANCTVEPEKIVCVASELGFYEQFGIDFKFIAPDILDGGAVVIHEAVASAGEEYQPADNTVDLSSVLIRHLRVTNTNDAGAGSLRQALIDGEALCGGAPCAIAFRIPAPVPDSGKFTIRPVTPLPDVRGFIRLEGATQTELTGDTNPDGPEIELDGSLQQEGHGLVLRHACDTGVSNLAMTNFRGHAIEIARDVPATTRCPTTSTSVIAIERNHLSGNERGVVQSIGSLTDIVSNVITNNRRAGIFLGSGFHINVRSNRITGNGASGIFLNVGGADVEDNIVAFNGEWGVARTKLGEIALRRNSIHGNTSQGVDVNLDNETPNVSDDSRSFPNKPVLFSASYDAARDVTIVRGRLASQIVSGYPTWHLIEVYASASLSVWGYAQGEQLVATQPLSSGYADFEIEVPGDQRGKFITAAHTRGHVIGFVTVPPEQSHFGSGPSDTSEFSNAIEVR